MGSWMGLGTESEDMAERGDGDGIAVNCVTDGLGLEEAAWHLKVNAQGGAR
jgi:hypothetical protein